MTITPVEADALDEVLDLVATEQADRSRGTTMLGDERAGVAAELDDLEPASRATRTVDAHAGSRSSSSAATPSRSSPSMVVMMPTSHLEPGVVIQASSNVPGLLDVGCFPKGTDERAERVAAALRAGGFESVVRLSLIHI